MLVPVIFAFDNSQTHDGIVHFAKRLVPPLVGALIDQLLDVNDFKRPVQNIEIGLVREILGCFFRGHMAIFYSVIPSGVEESLTISVFGSVSGQKYLEMSPIRLAPLAQGRLADLRLRRN